MTQENLILMLPVAISAIGVLFFFLQRIRNNAREASSEIGVPISQTEHSRGPLLGRGLIFQRSSLNGSEISRSAEQSFDHALWQGYSLSNFFGTIERRHTKRSR